jgi:hypothetical protein
LRGFVSGNGYIVDDGKDSSRLEALAASHSFDSSERIKSIPFIGEYNADECSRALVWLMTDKNIAACQEARKYLVRINNLSAAGILFKGIAVSHKQQRWQTLLEIKKVLGRRETLISSSSQTTSWATALTYQGPEFITFFSG